MFSESADIYDLLYSFKDYKKESGEIIDLIKSKRPGTRTILDIGCGTAEHHKYLQHEFLIDGLDISKEFIQLAQVKNSNGEYYVADMAEFELEKRYDAIMCLFSSIGYVKTLDKLISTLKCFSDHLKNEGLTIVEPWMTPDTWHPGKLHMLTYESDNIKICRMNQSQSEGNLSIINFHYLYGSTENGVRHFEERHELALFTQEEMQNAFHDADLDVSYDEYGITGRGLYFGTKKSAASE